MPWYKIFANHGGGHMGYSEFYEWFDVILSPDEEEEAWQEKFNETSNPSGEITLLSSLPVDVRSAKIKKYEQIIEEAESLKQQQIRHCQQMLTVLEETEAEECTHHAARWMQFPSIHSLKQCKHCKKLKIYGSNEWKEPNEEQKLLIAEKKLDRS